MTNPQVVADRYNVINLQERRLDRTVLRTYRTRADIDDIVPNEKQPRMGPKTDEELQRQIEANGRPLRAAPRRTASRPSREVPHHRRRPSMDQLTRSR